MLLTRRDRGMVALAIVLDVAFHSGGETVVNAADLAERTGMARRTLEPLLQALSRERLLDSSRGPHGGYRLGRRPRLIKVSEAITVGLNSLEESDHDLGGRLHRSVIAAAVGRVRRHSPGTGRIHDHRGPADASGQGRIAQTGHRSAEFCDLTVMRRPRRSVKTGRANVAVRRNPFARSPRHPARTDVRQRPGSCRRYTTGSAASAQGRRQLGRRPRA